MGSRRNHRRHQRREVVEEGMNRLEVEEEGKHKGEEWGKSRLVVEVEGNHREEEGGKSRLVVVVEGNHREVGKSRLVVGVEGNHRGEGKNKKKKDIHTGKKKRKRHSKNPSSWNPEEDIQVQR